MRSSPLIAEGGDARTRQHAQARSNPVDAGSPPGPITTLHETAGCGDDQANGFDAADRTAADRLASLLPAQCAGLTSLLRQPIVDRRMLAIDELCRHVRAAIGQRRPFGEYLASAGGSSLYRFVHHIADADVVQPAAIGGPEGAELKPHQLEGLRWLVSLHNNNLSGILADEPGLGKTLQVLALIAHLVNKLVEGAFLIVVPSSLVRTWAHAASRFAPDLNVFVYCGRPKKRRRLYSDMRRSQIVITTYHIAVEEQVMFARMPWLYVIVDEAAALRTPQTLLPAAITAIRSPFRLFISGSPIMNSEEDLWALLSVLMPDVFSGRRLQDCFGLAVSSTVVESDRTSPPVGLDAASRAHLLDCMSNLIQPFVLRRTKDMAAPELLKPVQHVVHVPQSALQRSLYDSVTTSTGKDSLISIQALTQLRKICNHPFSYNAVEDVFKGTERIDDLLIRSSGKIELLDRMLPKLLRAGHRILMFFQMTSTMDVFQRYLVFRRMRFLRLDGSVAQHKRDELIRLFNHPNSQYPLFLLSTRAGGVGLNLQSADTVILYDSDWNPQADEQAIGRAHRIGQLYQVTVFRLATVDTVEDTILSRANSKLEVFRNVLVRSELSGLGDDGGPRAIFEAASAAQSTVTTDEELAYMLECAHARLEIGPRGSGYRQLPAEEDWFASLGHFFDSHVTPRLVSEPEIAGISISASSLGVSSIERAEGMAGSSIEGLCEDLIDPDSEDDLSSSDDLD